MVLEPRQCTLLQLDTILTLYPNKIQLTNEHKYQNQLTWNANLEIRRLHCGWWGTLADLHTSGILQIIFP